MKFLVTGGAGFIGSHVIDLLAQRGHDILVLDNFSTGRIENLKQFENCHNVHIQEHDISVMANLPTLFVGFKPDFVIHLAAQAAITTAKEDPLLDLSVNGIGTLNLLRMAERYSVKRFVYASTSAVYQDARKTSEKTPLVPNTEYGISKLAGEMYVRLSNIPSTVLRFGNVYGPRQVPIGDNQVVAKMIRHFERGDKFLIFGDGKQKRDYVFVEDVAHAVWMGAMSTQKNDHIFNIASGKSYSILDIAKFIEEIYEVQNYRWEFDKERKDKRNVKMSVRSAMNNFGWKANTSLKDGLSKTIEWAKQ